MLTVMETTLEIAEGAASNDPNVGLRAVAALRALTERFSRSRARGWRAGPGGRSPTGSA